MRGNHRPRPRALSATLALALAIGPGAARAADEKPGSVHLQCDGLPASESIGSLLGAIVVITMTAGLAGSGEAADSSKQLKGDAGADACDAALAKDADETRRSQLKLAKAVHRIEASRHDEALAEARGLASVAPKLSAEKRFQVSMGLSAMEIEAATLVRMGRTAEAADLAQRMYEAAPYDLLNVVRAARLIEVAPEMTPGRRAFWENASRLLPSLLITRAEADEWAGDFAGAAEDLEAFNGLIHGFMEDPAAPLSPGVLARISVDRLLAGDLAGSERAAEEARKAVDHAVRNNKNADDAARGQELLDLQAIARMAADGKRDEARQAFAARSRWLAPSAPVVAELTRRLRDGAAPAQLTGALARDPDAMLREALDGKARGLGEDKGLPKLLLAARRLQPAGAFEGLSKRVWNTRKSPFVIKRGPKDTYKGEILFMSPYDTAADWESGTTAFVLHAALRARAEGKTHFIFHPTIRKFDTAVVRYGNLGDPDMPARAAFDAAKVISELSARIPEPPRKT